MSEIVFVVQARFPDAEASGRFFRVVYTQASGAEPEADDLAKLEGQGVLLESFRNEELDWELEECGVDERECLKLRANCSGEGSSVIGALAVAARCAGATSVLAILYDTSMGAYQALGATVESPVELFTTYDDEAVGDDYAAGVKRLLAAAHGHTTRIVEDGLLEG
jgi:hypothetical protein